MAANLGLQERAVNRYSVIFNGSEVSEDGVCFYEISVFDGGRQWTVQRRYREFRCLHKTLLIASTSVPKLPQKSQIRKRLSEGFRNRRYEELEDWLKAVVDVPECISSMDLQKFLQPDVFGQGDAEKDGAAWQPRLKMVASASTVASDASTAALTQSQSLNSLASYFDDA